LQVIEVLCEPHQTATEQQDHVWHLSLFHGNLQPPSNVDGFTSAAASAEGPRENDCDLNHQSVLRTPKMGNFTTAAAGLEGMTLVTCFLPCVLNLPKFYEWHYA
jgi:hypothetical protein